MNENGNLIQNEINIDSEDDCEEYFLQSTQGPYDIKEKIKVANIELFENYEACNIKREPRVTFREDLVDYEPEYSSDDGYVQSPDILSVISDDGNEENEEQNDKSLLNKYYLSNNPLDIEDYIQETVKEYENFENNLFDNTVNETNDNENEFQEEEITDEYNEILDEQCEADIDVEIEDQSEEQIVEVVEIINEISSSTEISTETSEESITKENELNNKHEIIKNTLLNVEKIICRLHCLDKKELDVLNGKPKNYDKYLKGPALKLRQRSCCSNKLMSSQLPAYNGFMSEYGMTKCQIEKKEKRKEKVIRSQREKKNRTEDEKKQKDIYNEEIFCAWLKSLKTRNQPSNKESKTKKNCKHRPQTVPHCNLSLAINKPKIKRPHTSSVCSFKIIIH